MRLGLEMNLRGKPIVRKLTFTGSTGVGKLLMKQCSGTVKNLRWNLEGTLHLSFLTMRILKQRFLEQWLVNSAMPVKLVSVQTGKMVQSKVYDKFTKMLADAANHLKVADGFEEGANQGPLINEAAVKKIESHVKDAIDKGAKLLAGGHRHKLGGTFFEPTVLSGVTTDMLVAKEETFGPMAPVFRFETEEEAIAKGK
ncbi:MAG: hypothetical protein Ct9H300mP21_00040 [Pseudomonadota bacterium]|nr:MAG: hypothetical protein Ct9H300mP21_00040 [Pseudomonadota bacterium]